MSSKKHASLLALLSVLLGAAHALSFAQTVEGAAVTLPWLQLLALAAFFVTSEYARSPRAALFAGLAFGAGWFGVGISWVFISLHVYGQMWAWLAALGTAAFCAASALYIALALWLTHRLFKQRALRLLLGLPAVFAAFEWLRGTLFTGFPWIASGYAHVDGPLAGWAPVLGIYGIGLAAALIAAALGALVFARQLPRPALFASLASALLLLGAGQVLRGIEWTQPTGTPLRVRLAQGSIPQDMKFGPEGLQRAADVYLGLLRGERVDLTVLPESVFPVPTSYLPESLTQALFDYSERNNSALVFGIFIEEPGDRYFNSALALTPPAENRAPQRYSKRHLVPFGEFIPPGFRWFVDQMQIPIGDQQRGEPYQAPFEIAGQRIAANICYEDLFGNEIARAWKDPAREPTLLLNITNLAWFGNSLALPQHLNISRMRALETGRPLLRATNTGATAVIDASGQVQQRLPYWTRGALVTEVRGYAGSTPYVYWTDWPALGLIGLALLAALILRSRGVRKEAA